MALAVEVVVVGIAAVVNGFLSLLVGYGLWRLRKQSKEKEQYRDDTDELKGIVKGVGNSETSLTKGLLHLVERHDEELDHAASERAEIRRRIRDIEKRIAQRESEYHYEVGEDPGREFEEAEDNGREGR